MSFLRDACGKVLFLFLVFARALPLIIPTTQGGRKAAGRQAKVADASPEDVLQPGATASASCFHVPFLNPCFHPTPLLPTAANHRPCALPLCAATSPCCCAGEGGKPHAAGAAVSGLHSAGRGLTTAPAAGRAPPPACAARAARGEGGLTTQTRRVSFFLTALVPLSFFSA